MPGDDENHRSITIRFTKHEAAIIERLRRLMGGTSIGAVVRHGVLTLGREMLDDESWKSLAEEHGAEDVGRVLRRADVGHVGNKCGHCNKEIEQMTFNDESGKFEGKSKMGNDSNSERFTLKPFDLVMIDLSIIDDNDIQPDKRDAAAVRKDLLESIKKTRVIVPPIVRRKSSGRYTVMDGHGRVAAAKKQGLTQLQCLVIELSPTEYAIAFHWLNNFTQPMTGIQRTNSYAKLPDSKKSVALGAMRKYQAKQIADAETILGREVVTELALDGHALSSIGKCVRAVLSWCENRGFRKPTPLRIAKWIIDHKASRLIDTAARKGKPARQESIVNAIHADKPFVGTVG